MRWPPPRACGSLSGTAKRFFQLSSASAHFTISLPEGHAPGREIVELRALNMELSAVMGASDSAALTGGGASDVPPPRASISIPPSTSSQPVPSSSSPPETLHQKVKRIKDALDLRTPANQIAACLREANAAMGFVNEDDLPKPQVAERLLRALGI